MDVIESYYLSSEKFLVYMVRFFFDLELEKSILFIMS